MAVWLSDDDTHVRGEVICSGHPQEIRRIGWPFGAGIFFAIVPWAASRSASDVSVLISFRNSPHLPASCMCSVLSASCASRPENRVG